MPHVALQQLKPELQEQNTQHDDEGFEDRNVMDGKGPVNAVENVDATVDAPATFQYDPHGQERHDGLVARSQATEFLRKVFKRIVIKRYRNNRVGERSETVGQPINYGNNENSDSDSEDDFRDATLLCGEHTKFEAQC